VPKPHGTDNDVRLVLRLPPDLHAILTDMAQRELRSLNSQIVYLLRHVAENAAAARAGSQQS